MKRRGLLLAGAAAAMPLSGVLAQAPRFRLGILLPAEEQWDRAAFYDELRSMGYRSAVNVEIIEKSAQGKLWALAGLAKELAAAPPEVIVTANTPGGRAAQAATSTIPIVVGASGDASLLGVRNAARPEGNVTGVTNMAGEIVAKRLEILKEALPRARRVAALYHPDEPIARRQMRDLEPASGALGVELRYLPARTLAEQADRIAEAAAWPADALFRLAGQALTFDAHAAALGLKLRIPVMSLNSGDVERGALLSYFADSAALWRRVAQYVDRLRNGARVIELPFERPTKFELAVNLRTARAIGAAISTAVMIRADKVIE